jgi:acyl-coenzyme A synthetase/AMP-(fatty) acid ligase
LKVHDVDDWGRCGNPLQVSSVELERVCNEAHDDVLETAAISVAPPGGGPERLVVFTVLRNGTASASELHTVIGSALKTKMNPLFKLEAVFTIESLPRTATNKVLRRVLRDIAKDKTVVGATLKSKL